MERTATRFDTDAIKRDTDLLELVGASALRKVSSTNGGEWAGPCPLCGGRDRFHVTARWWACRQCHPKRGDAIEFLRWRDGADFATACEILGGAKVAGDRARMRPVRRTPVPKPTATPAETWQARARDYLAWAESQLWDPANADALAYVRGRGLSDATIREAGLGYNPRTMKDDGAKWGQPGRVLLPMGWVIPCVAGDTVHYVKTRRPEGDPKYLAVRGSKVAGVVYGAALAQGHRGMILCEGEFNCLILRQLLGDAIPVASVGAATGTLGLGALAKLTRSPRWYLQFDPDDAGRDAAAKLASEYPRARVLSWPWDVDVNDAHLAGHDVAAAILAQVETGRIALAGEMESAWEIPRFDKRTGDDGKARAELVATSQIMRFDERIGADGKTRKELESAWEIPRFDERIGDDGKVRAELEATSEIPRFDKRVGDDGKTRKELESGGKIFHLDERIGDDGKSYPASPSDPDPWAVWEDDPDTGDPWEASPWGPELAPVAPALESPAPSRNHTGPSPDWRCPYNHRYGYRRPADGDWMCYTCHPLPGVVIHEIIERDEVQP
jgi:hypothetical protein